MWKKTKQVWLIWEDESWILFPSSGADVCLDHINIPTEPSLYDIAKQLSEKEIQDSKLLATLCVSLLSSTHINRTVFAMAGKSIRFEKKKYIQSNLR